jgi:hypothetical protein
MIKRVAPSRVTEDHMRRRHGVSKEALYLTHHTCAVPPLHTAPTLLTYMRLRHEIGAIGGGRTEPQRLHCSKSGISIAPRVVVLCARCLCCAESATYMSWAAVRFRPEPLLGFNRLCIGEGAYVLSLAKSHWRRSDFAAEWGPEGVRTFH